MCDANMRAGLCSHSTIELTMRKAKPHYIDFVCNTLWPFSLRTHISHPRDPTVYCRNVFPPNRNECVLGRLDIVSQF